MLRTNRLQMKTAASLLILTLTFCAPTAFSAPLKTLGFDDMSCAVWSQSKADEDQRTLYIAWIRGLLTGHNYANQSQQISVLSNGTVENFVDRFCVEKPKGDFGEAALRMSDRFSGRNKPITK